MLSFLISVEYHEITKTAGYRHEGSMSAIMLIIMVKGLTTTLVYATIV